MSKHKFQLKKDQIYIELNKVLQITGVAQTGGHAKIIIRNGEVLVNGTIETRVRKKLVIDDLITIGDISIKIE